MPKSIIIIVIIDNNNKNIMDKFYLISNFQLIWYKKI